MPSAKHERLYGQMKKVKRRPQTELDVADGPMMGYTEDQVRAHREHLKQRPVHPEETE